MAGRAEPDASRAEAGFRGAEATFREVGLVFPLAVTRLEHAERLAAVGQSADARPLLDEARETFERLGALPWLERTMELPSEGPIVSSAATPAGEAAAST
jgi:hypothetical protein